jgi:ubiquinone/menaquinone biosynthesis C-methylase UbiE
VNITRRTGASLASLPFPDASFDLITGNMVLKHLQMPAQIFQELSRVLAPGGILMVHTPNTRNYLVIANTIAKKLLPRSLVLKLVCDGRVQEDSYPTYDGANREPALRKLGHSANLQTESVRF